MGKQSFLATERLLGRESHLLWSILHIDGMDKRGSCLASLHIVLHSYPHYDESVVLDRLQLPTSIWGRLRSLITVSAALDQINHGWYPEAKLRLSITVNNLLLKTAECTYEMCWQIGRSSIETNVGAVMKYPELEDLKICVFCSLVCLFVCLEKEDRMQWITTASLGEKK